MLSRSGGSRHITMPNFLEICLFVAFFTTRDIVIFWFSRWLPPPSWIFEIAKFCWLPESRGLTRFHCAKCHQNRSFCCGDIAIFGIFKMAAAVIFDYWNHTILLANWVQRIETHEHAKLSWIVEFAKFYCWQCLRAHSHHYTKFSQNRSFHCAAIDFSNFKNGSRHLGLLKLRNFIGYWGAEGRDAAACQISPKSDNRLRRY